MGTSWSKNGWFPQNSNRNNSNGNSESNSQGTGIDPRRLASQFVYMRKGSMFLDEDGDLAHEFYEEVRDGKSQTTYMRRKTSHLKPQGNVYYKNPRLHVDFPIPMYSSEK